MAHNLFEEFVTENNLVLKAAGESRLIRVSRIPDPRFAHEVEPRSVHHSRLFSLRVGAEEYCCTENTLKCRDQSAILRSSLLHAEGIEHFCRTAKLNRLTLLADCQRG